MLVVIATNTDAVHDSAAERVHILCLNGKMSKITNAARRGARFQLGMQQVCGEVEDVGGYG